MMFKRKLLRRLKDAMETEDKLIPICANHCTAFSEYLEFDSSMRERFAAVFGQLRDDSRGHSDRLSGLVKTIEEEL